MTTKDKTARPTAFVPAAQPHSMPHIFMRCASRRVHAHRPHNRAKRPRTTCIRSDSRWFKHTAEQACPNGQALPPLPPEALHSTVRRRGMSRHAPPRPPCRSLPSPSRRLSISSSPATISTGFKNIARRVHEGAWQVKVKEWIGGRWVFELHLPPESIRTVSLVAA